MIAFIPPFRCLRPVIFLSFISPNHVLRYHSVWKKAWKPMSSFIGGLLRKKTIPYHINGGFNGNIIYRFWVFSTPCLTTRRVYISNSPIPMNSHGFTPPHGFFFIGTCCGRSSRPSWTSSWTERRRSGSMCPVPWLWWFRGLGSFHINVEMIYGIYR